jgi:hypothetical protein
MVNYRRHLCADLKWTSIDTINDYMRLVKAAKKEWHPSHSQNGSYEPGIVKCDR